MKIVYAVYHDLRWEARSKEVLQALQLIGDVIIITQEDIPEDCKNECTSVIIAKPIKGIPGSRLLSFMQLTKKALLREKPDIVVFHDDAYYIPLVRRRIPNATIVYDQSELVINRKIKSVKTFVLDMFDRIEKRNVPLVDIYISANKERENIAKQYFGLNCNLVVFNNIHKIDDICTDSHVTQKYDVFFSNTIFNVVYGGGIREDRGTYEMTDAFAKLGTDYSLLIAGNAWDNETSFKEYLKKHQIKNVHFIGFVSREEWGYLLKRADASMVYFQQNTVNNTYCASGKSYESLFFNTPIICSSNPPLKNLCEAYECGISGDDIATCVYTLRNDYQTYIDGVAKFIRETDYDNRIIELSENIKKYLGKRNNI